MTEAAAWCTHTTRRGSLGLLAAGTWSKMTPDSAESCHFESPLCTPQAFTCEWLAVCKGNWDVQGAARAPEAVALAARSGSSAPAFEPWAAAEALHGGTPSEAESRSAMPRWRFILRETRAIKPGDRLVWGERMMTISSVILEHRLIPKTILQAEEKR